MQTPRPKGSKKLFDTWDALNQIIILLVVNVSSTVGAISLTKFTLLGIMVGAVFSLWTTVMLFYYFKKEYGYN